MVYSNSLLTQTHKHCGNNRKVIAVSTKCGCFYCLEIYPAAEVTEYTSPADAICPKCGIDSVLADGSGVEISVPFLSAMSERWFGDAEYEHELEDK